MGWKMVYNSLDKNRENREKMLLTFAKNSIRSKPPPSFRAVYHNKNHVITNTVCSSSCYYVNVFLFPVRHLRVAWEVLINKVVFFSFLF